MDWRYSLFAAEQGRLGVYPLLAALVALLVSSLPGRKLLAISPSLVALATFAISCVVAGLSGVEHWPLVDHFPILSLLLTVILFVPSTLSLRNHWLGVIHLLTLSGALLCWFVASMAIAHDWL